jgi:uncharacterized protein (TIGR03435 family)
MTGLKGTYNVTLEISGDQFGESVFGAVEKLGLRLETKRVPAETLVIDKVARTPTPN